MITRDTSDEVLVHIDVVGEYIDTPQDYIDLVNCVRGSDLKALEASRLSFSFRGEVQQVQQSQISASQDLERRKDLGNETLGLGVLDYDDYLLYEAIGVGDSRVLSFLLSRGLSSNSTVRDSIDDSVWVYPANMAYRLRRTDIFNLLLEDGGSLSTVGFKPLFFSNTKPSLHSLEGDLASMITMKDLETYERETVEEVGYFTEVLSSISDKAFSNLKKDLKRQGYALKGVSKPEYEVTYPYDFQRKKISELLFLEDKRRVKKSLAFFDRQAQGGIGGKEDQDILF